MPRYSVAMRWVNDDVERRYLYRYSTFTEQPDDVIVIPVAELDERIESVLAALGHDFNHIDLDIAREILEA